MVAKKTSRNIEGVWLVLRESFNELAQNAAHFWSVSDWQVRVCLILTAMLLLNVILIGIAWRVYGGVISQMYSTSKAKRKSSNSLRTASGEGGKDYRKKTD